MGDPLRPQESRPASVEFTTTHWSVVLAAGEETSEKSEQALAILCRSYWYPLYAYVRRQGYEPAEAQDLTQDFFTRLLTKNYLGLATPQRGRFRTFLLSSLKNFLVNEWRRSQRQKRGGSESIFSLEQLAAEERFAAEPADPLDPEKIYEKRWAATLLENVLARSRADYAAEPFEMSHREIEKGAVVIIDDENPGKLKLSERAYDTRVAGIVSGAGGVNAGLTLQQTHKLDGGQQVALSGRVYVQADASTVPIRPGDLLTTSDIPGHAMRVSDPARAQGAILGKAMTGLVEGKGLVLVLVTLQ